MNGAWSNTTVNLVPSPIAASSSGSASRTACDTATVLPAGDFVMRDGQRRLAVDAGDAGDRVIDELDGRDVGDRGLGITAQQWKRGDLVGRLEPRTRLHRERLVVLGDLAGGQQHTVVVEGRRGSACVVEAAQEQLVLVRRDDEALLGGAEQRDIADVVELLQLDDGGCRRVADSAHPGPGRSRPQIWMTGRSRS